MIHVHASKHLLVLDLQCTSLRESRHVVSVFPFPLRSRFRRALILARKEHVFAAKGTSLAIQLIDFFP